MDDDNGTKSDGVVATKKVHFRAIDGINTNFIFSCIATISQNTSFGNLDIPQLMCDYRLVILLQPLMSTRHCPLVHVTDAAMLF